VFDAYDAADIGPEPGVTYAVEIRWVDPDTDATLEPPAAVIDVGAANSITLTKEDVPILAAPTGTKHFEVRVQARRTTGTISYEAWQARSIRLFMPDGIKVAEVSAWTEIGADTRLTVAETAIFLDCGGAVQLTIAEASIWIGFGSDARLTMPDIDIFNEWGGQSRLTAAEAALYIEVLP
jgi:hypothetical protein